MGFFDDKKNKQLEYLEEERKKLWYRLTLQEKLTKLLQDEIKKKASDSEREAAQSSRKAAEFRNKTEERLTEAVKTVNEINSRLLDAEKVKVSVQTIKEKIEEEQEAILAIRKDLEDTELVYKERVEVVQKTINNFDEFLRKYPDLETEMETVEDNIGIIENNVEKSNLSLSQLNKRKKEVDVLYREIFGYNSVDEDGNEIKIDGLKDNLAEAYSDLASKIKSSFMEVTNLDQRYLDNYQSFEANHVEKYKKITAEIESLLPNALTAGLSAAFSKKKEEEVRSSEKLQQSFLRGIYFLIGVSLIPLAASITFIVQGLSLHEAISRLPRLVLAIVPMYIPVLWMAYSASKKLNLSKRLIEEYSHKEVLSKTYEGLAKQIASITDSNQSEDLRFKLLSNFLQVSSENPGKLISNYEASDHPIMEALEQSYKFQVAIDKLEGIPGLGKVAAMLESRTKRRIEEREAKINKALVKEHDDDCKSED